MVDCGFVKTNHMRWTEDVVCRDYNGLTLPLALKPVNQMVRPVWPSNSTRSAELTEPTITG